MNRRRPPLLLALALGALVAPCAAHAATVSVTGQVAGTPYAASATRSAVPVLLSKVSAERAHLRTPMGLAIVARRRAIAAPGGSVVPSHLRLGDRFKARIAVSGELRKAAYPRMTLRRMRVTRRSTDLSNAELQEAIAQTQSNVRKLSLTVNDLSTSTQQRFTGLSLTGDLPTSLTTQITGLLVNLSGLQGTVAGLGGQVTTVQGTVSSLQGGLSTVTSLVGGVDVAGLSSTVSGLSGNVGNLITSLGASPTGVAPASITSLSSAVTGAQSQVNGILSYLSPTDSSLATTADNVLDQASATLSTLTGTTIPALTSKVDTVCTTWRSLLSGATAPVYNLLSVLLGNATLPTLPGC